MANHVLTNPEHVTDSPQVMPETKVLIVDDSAFDCEHIERQCRRTNLYLSIDTASSVQAMKAAMDTTEYDVIFVDYNLTQETGLEAQEAIREHPSHTKAATIMMTGQVNHEIAVSAIKSGCQDYVAKSDMDAMSIELMMKTAAKRLEKHASRVLQNEMEAIHDRTMGAVSEVVNNALGEERLVSALVRALGQVSYIEGQPIVAEPSNAEPLVDDGIPAYFVFK